MSSPARENTVHISAKAAKKFKPDIISLEINYHGEHTTKDECVKKYNQDVIAVQEALRSAGVSSEKIKNNEFTLRPHKERLYERCGKDRYYCAIEKLKGYEYEATTAVKVIASSEMLEKVWLAMRKVDGDFSYDIEYELNDKATAEMTLLQDAIADAHTRAQVLTRASGATLGNVSSIYHEFRYGTFCDYDRNMAWACCDGDSPRDAYEVSDIRLFVPDYNPSDITVSCAVDIAWHLG